MGTVLVVSPRFASGPGRQLDGDLVLELCSGPDQAVARARERHFDLLVLADMPVDLQSRIAHEILALPRWRHVRVLYTVDLTVPGLVIASTFRPGIDAIVRGGIDDGVVLHRMRQLAGASRTLIVAGPFALDVALGRLHMADTEVMLSARESEILALLLARPNRLVMGREIIETSWGTAADSRHRQILRRHVCNMRRKLKGTAAARSVRTVRGSGYRFQAVVDGHRAG